ncbi:T9SS type B sorting domain-containing protein [Ichthyobacterium seriolicida]|uniref:PKD domain-containing protein n=1 Tax=Ichthyobacterium seriolicida TaxID=242600 RepID=A0A1J1DWU5_9FLAO|nr:T9SS type B sorting domain-containing protein [Ichthyobacterium seriolicida]BAV94321.1 hypothetical protein JBKA6_0308 [Ichthyobacterium seriolicida]
MKFNNRIFFISLLVAFTVSFSYAQRGRAYNWHFGQKADITFGDAYETPSIETKGNSNLISPEACASISSVLGELLFYTDGNKVWKADNTEMAGSLLSGANNNTQTIIVPIPKAAGSTDDKYYVFYIDSNSKCKYAIVDMTTGGGNIESKDTDLFTGDYNGVSLTHKMAVIEHYDQSSFWLVLHERNSRRFFSYKISSTGIDPEPVVTSIGKKHINPEGYMKASRDGKLLGLVVPNVLGRDGKVIVESDYTISAKNRGFIEVFGFNNRIGKLTSRSSLNKFSSHEYNGEVKENENYGYYGLEFSPNSKFLYVTERYSGNLFQVDLDKVNNIISIPSASVDNPGDSSYANALQLGPDNKIYAAMFNPTTPAIPPVVDEKIGVIESPDSEYTPAFNYNDQAQNLAVNKKSREGLPSFVSTFFYDFSSRDYCVGGKTKFKTSIAPEYKAYYGWDFGDGSPSVSGFADSSTRDVIVEHQYANEGTYKVTLTLVEAVSSESVTFSQDIIVKSPINIPAKEIIACAGSSGNEILTSEYSAYGSYLWSTGEKTRSIVVDKSGTYTVEIIDENECVNTEVFNVTVGPPNSVSEKEIRMCSPNMAVLTSSLDSVTYLWSTRAKENTKSIKVYKPGNYSVTTYSKKTNCTIVETFKVLPFKGRLKFVKRLLGRNLFIDKELNAESPYSYYLDDTKLKLEDIRKGLYLNPGTYVLTLEDNRGCTYSEKIEIPKIYAPKVFTPNGDGKNDFWEISGIEDYPDAEIVVADRTGKILRRYNGRDEHWNGLYNGILLPVATYWYVIKLDEKEYRGSVSIIK